MNKKRVGAFVGAAVAVAAAAGIGAGTFASFSDQKTSEPTTATAGTMELEVGQATGDAWAAGSVAPNQTLPARTLTIKNRGDVAGNLTLKLTAAGAGLENGVSQLELDDEDVDGSGDSELPAHLKVFVTYAFQGEDPVVLAGRADEFGEPDEFGNLSNVPGTPNYALNLASPVISLAGGATVTVKIVLQVDDADNIIQSDKADLTLTAMLEQA